MILSLVALSSVMTIHPASVQSVKPVPWTLVWHRKQPTNLNFTGSYQYGTVMTERGQLSFRDGTLTRTTQPSMTRLSATKTLSESVLARAWATGGDLSVFWDTPQRKLAFRRSGMEVFELKPGTNTIVTQLRFPKGAIPKNGFGNPDSGLFSIGWWSDARSMNAVQYLVLKPAKLSPLRFFNYCDLNRPQQGVLGISLPKGQTLWSIGNVRHAPQTPLACGDPFTGRVRWSNPRFSWGAWLGSKWIIARRSSDQSWWLLSAVNGHETYGPIPDFGKASPAQVQTAGPYLLLMPRSGGDARCYRIKA